jgi:hypothetical protein
VYEFLTVAFYILSKTAIIDLKAIVILFFFIFVIQQSTRKRKLDQLISAETIDAGKLREAATRKDDQQILIRIADKDCVALEVKYHRSCYRNYTCFLSNTRRKVRVIENASHIKSFDTSDNDDEEDGEPSLTFNKRMVELKDFYFVALALRENIQEHCSSWYKNWPPLASDITGDSVRKVVSPLLFNFMAWVLGYSDEPQESSYVDMYEENSVKVFSICQDVVYNGRKGKTQTPKSLALAMAVRQISGCSNLIRILNGLGHCVSLSSTMAYDSAIAQLVIETSDIVPREFVAGNVNHSFESYKPSKVIVSCFIYIYMNIFIGTHSYKFRRL